MLFSYKSVAGKHPVQSDWNNPCIKNLESIRDLRFAVESDQYLEYVLLGVLAWVSSKKWKKRDEI